MLIAFEGLDQSGKETQARHLRARIEQDGWRVHPLSFPDYDTPVGMEIKRALAGEREFGPDVMQLLYVANRCEFRAKIELWPEGPQQADLAPDILAAFKAEPKAAAFFDDLAQFYRKAYLAWIDATKKKPEERVRRIRETVKLLKAGKKERPK